MDHRDELQKLHHQLELANRAIPMIGDPATVQRLERFAEEIKAKLDDLQGAVKREATGRRAFELWHEAGRPEGRDLEFWLRAEGEQPGSCRTSTGTSPAAWNREQADDLNPRTSFPADSWPARTPPLSPEAPRGEPVPSREDRMAHVYEDDIRARAYKLWDEAGRPKGRMDEFWQKAERQLEEEQVKRELKTPDTL
jgi:Protein of unknown function (DUF2934)